MDDRRARVGVRMTRVGEDCRIAVPCLSADFLRIRVEVWFGGKVEDDGEDGMGMGGKNLVLGRKESCSMVLAVYVDGTIMVRLIIGKATHCQGGRHLKA